MDPRPQRALQHLRVSAGELGYPHTHLSDAPDVAPMTS